MKTLPQPWSVGMEATIFSGWIYDHLLPHAAQIKVAHPLMLRAIASFRPALLRPNATRSHRNAGSSQRFNIIYPLSSLCIKRNVLGPRASKCDAGAQLAFCATATMARFQGLLASTGMRGSGPTVAGLSPLS